MRKTAQESATDATLQDDDHLYFSIGANEVWTFTVWLDAFATTDQPDIKIGFSVPSGATIRWGGVGPDTSDTSPDLGSARFSTVTGTSVIAYGTDDLHVLIQLWGTVVNDAIAGEVKLRWAQNSDTGATLVEANSSLVAVRVQ